jgi:hypothetical protein
MPRTSVMQRPSASLTHIPWYPKDLLHEVQTTLAAVADIDVRYDIEREQIAANLGSRLSKVNSHPSWRTVTGPSESRMFSVSLNCTTR